MFARVGFPVAVASATARLPLALRWPCSLMRCHGFLEDMWRYVALVFKPRSPARRRVICPVWERLGCCQGNYQHRDLALAGKASNAGCISTSTPHRPAQAEFAPAPFGLLTGPTI